MRHVHESSKCVGCGWLQYHASMFTQSAKTCPHNMFWVTYMMESRGDDTHLGQSFTVISITVVRAKEQIDGPGG